MEQIAITTTRKKEVVDITEDVAAIVHDQGVKNGIVCIMTTHTTCSITTADLDPGTDQDMLDAITAMMPKLNYRHPHDPPHVVDHIAASMMGPSLTVIVNEGELVLGEWQRIVLIDFDGPRKRILWVKSLM